MPHPDEVLLMSDQYRQPVVVVPQTTCAVEAPIMRDDDTVTE
jgi:hypothetical protein